MAAIEAGKHVYCEWPLGRDTAEAVADARCGGAQRDPPRGRAAGPGVPGDQLRQGSGRPGLCRPGAGGDDDRLRPELGSLDRPRLSGRPRQRRQPVDDYRRPYDRRAVLLPGRIPRACRALWSVSATKSPSRQPARSSRRRRPTSCRQWHCRGWSGRVVPGARRHGARDRFPVRNSWRRGRPRARRHFARLRCSARS